MLSSKPFGLGRNGTAGLESSLASVIAIVVLRAVDLEETSVAPLKERVPKTTAGANANMVDVGYDTFVRKCEHQLRDKQSHSYSSSTYTPYLSRPKIKKSKLQHS